MARVESCFTLFGRIGVIPSQLLPSCLRKIENSHFEGNSRLLRYFQSAGGGLEVTAPARMERRKREKIDAECILQNKNSYSQKVRCYD